MKEGYIIENILERLSSLEKRLESQIETNMLEIEKKEKEIIEKTSGTDERKHPIIFYLFSKKIQERS